MHNSSAIKPVFTPKPKEIGAYRQLTRPKTHHDEAGNAAKPFNKINKARQPYAGQRGASLSAADKIVLARLPDPTLPRSAAADFPLQGGNVFFALLHRVAQAAQQV